MAVTSPVQMYQFAAVTSPMISTSLAPQASSPPTKLNLPVRDELQSGDAVHALPPMSGVMASNTASVPTTTLPTTILPATALPTTTLPAAAFPALQASAPPTYLDLPPPPPPEEWHKFGEAIKAMSPMSGCEFGGFSPRPSILASDTASVPVAASDLPRASISPATSVNPAMLTKKSTATPVFGDFEPSDDRRPIQALPRASNVVPAQVAAFSEEVKMASRLSSVSQAQEPTPLISTMSNVSEVMSFPQTPLSSSFKVIKAPAVVPASTSLPKVLSSPSEADPLMWSHGFNSLGSIMAAKAMGKLPALYEEAIPPPSTMLKGPSTFFDVDLEKVGLSPLPLVTPDTDLSKEIPTPPCEPGSLTAGLTDPETVERCRDSYNLELDRQLHDATRKLEQANAEKKHRLREEARRLREQYNAEVDNELLEQARVVVERFSDRLAVLQEEADRQRQRLEKEAQELMKESQRYYHFKAEARRLLGSSGSLMPSLGWGGRRGYGGYGQLPRWDHEDLPAFPTLFSQRSPNLQDLLNGASNPLYGSAPPPPPPPPKLHSRDMPPPSNTSLAPPSLAPPPPAPKPSGTAGTATAPAAPPSPVGPTAQAVPVMAPIRCQSTVSAGVSPMSATRFLQTVNRGIQAGSPPGPSPVATFHGTSEWTPPETPRPCPALCPSAPLHMPSRSPLGALQVPQGSTKVWHPAPRGVSQHFTSDMFYQGDFMGNLANPIPTPCRTGMSDLSEKVTSV